MCRTTERTVNKGMNVACFIGICIRLESLLTELIYTDCCHNERLIGAQGNNRATE